MEPTKLDLSYMNLTSLPELYESLEILLCHGNQLESLPKLPPSLKILGCHSNRIQSLPDLPPKLEQLLCNDNQLTFLPSLPESLRTLCCHGNQLQSMPDLPTNLALLGCGDNKLNHIPRISSTVKELWCSGNPWATEFGAHMAEKNNVVGVKRYYKMIDMKRMARDVVTIPQTLAKTYLPDDVLAVISSFLCAQPGTLSMQIARLQKILQPL
jgi:hypothetical protein